MEELDFDLVIIGAGVVGLTLAQAAAKRFPTCQILVIERHAKLGCEISSHNSEVIHAGIYYQDAPEKAKYCVAGNAALYEFCETYEIPFRRCGKYVIASSADQRAKLEQIQATATRNQARVSWLEKADLPKELSGHGIEAALWSPTTGIIDSHSFMYRCEQLALERGVVFLYKHAFSGIVDLRPGSVVMRIADPQNKELRIKSRVFVNCGGLASARIAQQFGFTNRLEIRPCRGRYFGLSSIWTEKFQSLLYPIPDPQGGLGIHLTFDRSGKCRLGPDVDWERAQEIPDDIALYNFSKQDEAWQADFLRAGQKLIPGLLPEHIQPDFIGVRPKLFIDGKAYPDFYFAQRHFGTDWHLLGIESPGLTAAPAIAEKICQAIASGL